MRSALAVVVLASCGRVGFDGIARGDAGGSGSPSLSLTYATPRAYAVVGVTRIALDATVSAPASFAIAPPLPAGVTIDPASGAITGVPTASAEMTYTVTATADSAKATATIALTALPGYVVDTTADTPDATSGNDATCADAAGHCSLRAAIMTLNGQGGPGLVLLGEMPYVLGSQLPAITSDVMIVGQPGATTLLAQPIHAAYAALALATAHTLRLRDLAIDDFGGSDGGALAVTAGTLDVDRCSFTNNASQTSGGVLFINGGAKATLAHSTFTQNASLGGNGGGWGGVIDGEGAGTAIVVSQCYASLNKTAWGAFSHITTGTTLLLETSTLYGNTSTTAGTLATPGGIYTLVNDTIVGNTNTVTDSAGIYLFSAPCHYDVTNTIVAFNSDSAGEHDCNIRDPMTTITSGGGNIIADTGTNCASYFTAAGDRLSTDPGIAPGAPVDNGGATPTLLLGSNAAALTGGVVAACPAVDQRDVPHAVGICDVGAVQMP